MTNVSTYNNALHIYYYDQDSGVVVYKNSCGNRHHAGDEAGHYNDGYLVLRVGKQKIPVHRFAFYCMKGYLPTQVDHINRVRDDNRWINLRECTNAENMRNRCLSKANSSGYRGVSRHYGKWRGKLMVNGVVYQVSSFATAELANDWVVAKSKEVYGEFYQEINADS